MSGSLNRATLIGHCGADPELRSLKDGKRVAHVSIATSQKFKNKLGVQEERTEWHRVVIFAEHIVGVVEKYVRKGDLIFVEGELRSRKWTDKDGVDRWTSEIVLPQFGATLILLERAPAKESAAA